MLRTCRKMGVFETTEAETGLQPRLMHLLTEDSNDFRPYS